MPLAQGNHTELIVHHLAFGTDSEVRGDELRRALERVTGVDLWTTEGEEKS